MGKIDLDFFEKVLFQHCLKKDSLFLASCVEHLDSALFRDKNIGAIVQIIKDFYLENNSIPSHTELKIRINTSQLKTNLKNAIDSIRGLDQEYAELELLKNTEYFIKQRSFDNLLEKSIEQRVSTKELDLDNIQKENDRIQSISLIDNLGLDYFGDIDRVEKYLLQTDNLISCGYPTLDGAFGGGFMREGRAIYDIGGETNIGKSIYLANIAVNLIRNNENVVLISPEMSENRYAKRISGILTGIALANLPEEIDNFREYINDFISDHKAKLIIKEVATKSLSAKGIKAFIQQLERKKKFVPNLIAIDGHALLKPSTTQPSKHTEMQYIVQECRGLSYVFNAPVLTVAQLNRSSHKATNPGLDTMSASWDQLADFDAHVNIWQTDIDREENIIRFGGKKVRDGQKGIEGFLKIDYDTLRLYEVDSDNCESAMQEKNIGALLDLTSL